MIINSELVSDKFQCGKAIMRYLVSTGVPILSYDERYFYFANTELLKKSLKAMPLHLKMLAGLSGRKEVK